MEHFNIILLLFCLWIRGPIVRCEMYAVIRQQCRGSRTTFCGLDQYLSSKLTAHNKIYLKIDETASFRLPLPLVPKADSCLLQLLP